MINAIERESKVFISTDEAFQATHRLKRLITLENGLSSVMNASQKRLDFIQKIVSIWKQFDESGNFHQIQTDLANAFSSCCVRQLKILPRFVVEEMVSKISSARSLEELQCIREQVLKDCRTLEVSKMPVNKSFAGRFGPTLLVEYSNPGQKRNSLVSYVLKWTDKRETAGYMVYEALLSELPFNLCVPENSWYDFKNRIFLDSNGLLQELEEEPAEELKNSFFSIPPLLEIETIHGEQLLVLERIKGGNLAEFFRFNYQGFNDEQRKNLFRDFGRLVFLDLLLGNTDRLLHLQWGRDYVPTLATEGSNLGNLMLVERADGEHFIYSIDNAIEADFVDDPHKRKNYSQFLHSLLQKNGFEKDIADSLLMSFQSAFTNMVDECKEEKPELYQQLEESLQCIRGNQCMKCLQGELCSKENQCAKGDLDREFTRLAIEEGILDMAAQCEKLLVKWKSPQADFLKTQLRSFYPEFLETLEERFHVFETVCLERRDGAVLNPMPADLLFNKGHGQSCAENQSSCFTEI